MKNTLLAMALLLSASVASAAPAPAPVASSAPASTTIALEVFGLNCSLCSEKMKTKLMQLSGARDIEPRLECGKIYLDMPAGAKLNEHGLSAALKENGFTYDGANPAKKTLAEVRKTSPESCS